MPQAPIRIQLDIAIIGGGIAGLWLANRLKSAGFRFALFEHKALGSDQTMASQGMIHGGMKYTLSGALTGASETIADMPNHWRACLCGDGEVDLRNTRVLSDHFFLWSSGGLTAKLNSFLASKTLRGRVETVPLEHCPPLFRHADFEGNLYKLVDIVIDAHSLVTNLAHNIDGRCFLIDWSKAHWQQQDGELSLELEQDGCLYQIHAQRFVFCAGKGNGELLQTLGLPSPAMQLRPLQQVLVKHRYAHNFYGHCVGTGTSPRLTISTHRLNSGDYVWYLGGSLAEKGADLAPEALIDDAKAELAELLPWLDFSQAEYATLAIDRAEPHQPGLARPDNAFAEPAPGLNNLLVGWPTKLTLAPNLANQVLDRLAEDGIKPSATDTLIPGFLPAPPVAATPWDLAFPPSLSVEERLQHRLLDTHKDSD